MHDPEVTPPLGEGYRFLEPGEKLVEGDEYYWSVLTGWKPTLYGGRKHVQPSERCFYRRKVEEVAVDPGYWQWLQLYTGGQLFIEPSQPAAGFARSTYTILDIAHGLACENRYAGQTDEPYSVAQHSVHVMNIVEHYLQRPDRAFEALMHDAAEGFLKDLPRPLKIALGEIYKPLEHALEADIARRFGLAFPWDPIIKQADNIALMTERRDLFRCRNENWTQHVEPMPNKIIPLNWLTAEKHFLFHFKRLEAQRKNGAGK